MMRIRAYLYGMVTPFLVIPARFSGILDQKAGMKYAI